MTPFLKTKHKSMSNDKLYRLYFIKPLHFIHWIQRPAGYGHRVPVKLQQWDRIQNIIQDINQTTHFLIVFNNSKSKDRFLSQIKLHITLWKIDSQTYRGPINNSCNAAARAFWSVRLDRSFRCTWKVLSPLKYEKWECYAKSTLVVGHFAHKLCNGIPYFNSVLIY